MAEDKTISGLQVEIKPTELRKLLQDKSKYHEGRAKLLEEQLKKLKEGGVALSAVEDDEVATVAKSSNYQAEAVLKTLQDAANTNREKAKVYAFIATHLAKKTYRLHHEDMVYLGLAQRHW
jgi:hypothetical protein